MLVETLVWTDLEKQDKRQAAILEKAFLNIFYIEEVYIKQNKSSIILLGLSIYKWLLFVNQWIIGFHNPTYYQAM